MKWIKLQKGIMKRLNENEEMIHWGVYDNVPILFSFYWCSYLDWLDDCIVPIKQKRTKENNKDKEYMRDIDNQTEKEFKDHLRSAMYDDIKYTPCLVPCVDEVINITSQAQPANGCEFCIEGHKKFLEDEDTWLEGRWQDELERRNVVPCSDEEMDAIFAEQGIMLDRKTRRFELINK